METATWTFLIVAIHCQLSYEDSNHQAYASETTSALPSETTSALPSEVGQLRYAPTLSKPQIHVHAYSLQSSLHTVLFGEPADAQ